MKTDEVKLKPTMTQEVEPRTTVAEKVETQNNNEIAENHNIIEINPSQPIAGITERSIQGDMRVDSEYPAGTADPRTMKIDIPLSNRIHIIGFNIEARFLAYALASRPNIPIKLLVHHPRVMSRWGTEDRELSLFNSNGDYMSSARIPCPEPVSDPRYRYPETRKQSELDVLDNIIIDTTTGAVLPSLQTLSHRIDRHTTICLLHPGLGLVERINEVLFPDPFERPNFILGHNTHKVGRVHDTLYSLKQRRTGGALYLWGVPKFEDPTLAKSPIAQDGIQQSRHLINLLASTETLGAVGLHQAQFLSWKLPWLIFSSVADAICVVLGCKYNKIHPNPHAWTMWGELLDECLTIVSQLPELKPMPHLAEYFTGHSFRRKMRNYLVAQKSNGSPWVKRVRMGVETPVDYFNGYLVRRAEELGLDHKYNSMAMEMVKARQNARWWEMRVDLLQPGQYMGDADTIGGGQPVPSLDDFIPDVDVD
ncbi:hypothetical protein F5Y09DRAFT_314491 [Xylaria sp. FL1042]|nr:hypothetical protein F5Y09DRAFT_314491 [Xylaria sp. FL1042]